MNITVSKHKNAEAVPEIEFLKARRGEGVNHKWAPPLETWFAVKTAPGFQRCPSIIDGDSRKPADKDDGGRKLDSIVERNLKNEGFEVFMPSYRLEVRHHRNKRWIEKRFPTFVGYLFINIGPDDFRTIEEVTGVSKILRFTRSDGSGTMPFAFPQATIDRLRYIAWEQEQNFLVARARRQREEEIEQEQRSRGKPVNASSRRIRRAQFTDLGGGLSSSLSLPSSRAFITETLKTLTNMAGELD
ncbi:transcription termination/antitermination NusG family protein [Rhizobium sp. BT-175]|uniref:transcription termination/antitermination NusG family protein n=1 Tax=Rhizobium sp. BT-175 TaxID=2986929 RepID=UPI0022355D86|nr:transcription termination/antitermination NusG family protein [Rhizobium sp. BT-175]MCV9943009.1 transcription termination/antitermination NusG family protein [Rhizobium sp. BT-175]